MQKIILLALLSTLALSFTPVTFNYNFIELECAEGACSDDFNTCACTINNAIRIYQRGSTSYLAVGSIIPTCTSAYNYSCSLNGLYMKSDGSRLIVKIGTDSTYKAYDLTNTSYPQVGTINFGGGSTYMNPMKGDYFFVSTWTEFQFFHFEPTNSSYVLNYTYTIPSNVYSYDVSCSSDGKMIVYSTFKYG